MDLEHWILSDRSAKTSVASRGGRSRVRKARGSFRKQRDRSHRGQTQRGGGRILGIFGGKFFGEVEVGRDEDIFTF